MARFFARLAFHSAGVSAVGVTSRGIHLSGVASVHELLGGRSVVTVVGGKTVERASPLFTMEPRKTISAI